MAANRRNQAVLMVLAVVLAGLAYRAWSPATGTSATQSNAAGGAPRTPGSVASLEAPAVRLDILNQERMKPSGADRNLFRFKDKAAPPPVATVTSPAPPPTEPSAPGAASALPPI